MILVVPTRLRRWKLRWFPVRRRVPLGAPCLHRRNTTLNFMRSGLHPPCRKKTPLTLLITPRRESDEGEW